MPRKKEKEISEQKSSEKVVHVHKYKRHCGGAGGVYGLGFIGALVYYLSTATSFGMGAIGVLKAIVWPGFLVFELLKFLGV